MVPVLEAVPNFSEGRDPDLVRDLVDAVAREGAEVLDWSADFDHHRSVVTFLGDPRTVENASVAVARVAVERIDLRAHEGVHPRVGALDVLPFVPLAGLEMADAVRSVRRAGRRIAQEVAVPVFLYGEASDPPGRRLAELRRGGYEPLRERFPEDLRPDFFPLEWNHAGAHPTAGAVCAGARPVLLAWNAYVEGIGFGAAKKIARRLRETGGGLPGLRALALRLPSRGRMQLSMNLEDLRSTSPVAAFRALETEVAARGGRVSEVEVIGMIPDELGLSPEARGIPLSEGASARLLSSALRRHVAARTEGAARRPPAVTAGGRGEATIGSGPGRTGIRRGGFGARPGR